MSKQNEKQQIDETEELNKPYDCRVTIRSKLKMIPKIKERISSSKKRLDLFKNTVFGKWLDFDDTNYDNHLLKYVLHHQRPDLSKSVDSDILFDIAGRTLLLVSAEFCLVIGFACGKVVFPKYLNGGIPLFVRRMFPDKLKKLEKNKDGELVQDKAAKGKAAQSSVMIKDLGELVQKDAKWKKLSADDSVRVCLLYMSELIFRGPEDKKVVPAFMLRLVDDLAAWNNFALGEYYWEEYHNKDSNPTTKLQPTDAEMGQNWYRKSYDYLNSKEKSIPLDDLGGVSQDDESDAYTRQDGRGATVGAKVSGESMNDADMSAIVHEDPSDAAINGEHMDVIGHPDENERPNEKEDPSDAATDGEHMDVVGHPDKNEGPNAKEDPLDAAINGEHMDTIGSLDETEEPNKQEPISHVLNTPVDNGDVLMTDAPDTINFADPPSHVSEIMSPCGSEKKGDGLDGAKANQGMLSTADNGEVVNEPQLPDSHEDLTRDSKATKTRIHVSKEVLDFFNQVQKPGYHFPWGTGFTVDDKYWQCLFAKDANRKGNRVMDPVDVNAHWFLAEFQIRTGVITFYDTLNGLESWQKENLDWWLSLRVMMIEQLPQGMSKHGIFKKKDIDPERYNITFDFSNHAPKQANLYGDCSVWVCIMMYRLVNDFSMDFPLGMEQSSMDLKMHSFRNI
ncbi:phospholipase-like protein [Tanacetum coccineum]